MRWTANLVTGGILVTSSCAFVGAVMAESVPPPAEPVVQQAAPSPTTADPPAPWAPPGWFPGNDALWVLSELDQRSGEIGPDLGLTSRAVFVYDLDAGEILLAQSADTRLPVASLTKLVTGLTMAAESPDLNAEICLDQELMPSWPGAGSRLSPDVCAPGWDLLGAALVRSDNGAAYALSRIADLPYDRFVDQMNHVAGDLGMTMSTFSGATGVEDDNISSARDITRAVISASLHPTLAPVVNAPFWEMTDTTGLRWRRRLRTTNRLIDRPELEFMAAKTGYTDTARHCFSAVVQGDRKLALTVLGAPRGSERWMDVRKILQWSSRLGRSNQG